MTVHLKIDFVSDVACPWCAIGLLGLEQALAQASDAIDAEIVFHPFELNPDMPPGGRNVAEHLAEAYGASPADLAASRRTLVSRAASLGFAMAMTGESRSYNTFAAHRLLHWARGTGRQAALKHALLAANFSDNLDVGDPEVLAAAAARAGLDPDAARDIAGSDRFAPEVRAEERLWQARGINSVPAIVVNERYLISGGHPPEVFEQALRRIASRAGSAGA